MADTLTICNCRTTGHDCATYPPSVTLGAYHDFDSDCPHGDHYAHSITDLIPERAWDPESKPRATEPCPLGYGCPVYQPSVIVTTSSTNFVPWHPVRRPGCGGPADERPGVDGAQSRG